MSSSRSWEWNWKKCWEGCSVSKALGIKTNAKKTMVMTIRNRKAVPMVAEGKTFDCVPEYVYLGQAISFNRTPGIEITRQIRLA